MALLGLLALSRLLPAAAAAAAAARGAAAGAPRAALDGEVSSLVQVAAARSQGARPGHHRINPVFKANASQGEGKKHRQKAPPAKTAVVEPPPPNVTAPEFDDSLSRMLYGFQMLASCADLMTPLQIEGSRCKLCEAAGFDFTPGDLRVAHLRESFGKDDKAAAVARVRPRRQRRPGAPARRAGCVVAIRGTNTVGNVVTDANVVMDLLPGCPGCAVHRGWLGQWNVMRLRVLKMMAELGCNSPDQALYLTGHSSGCAVIDYAAYDLHTTQGNPIAASIGYDCPRPGGAKFAQAFDAAFPDNVWKVQVDFDIMRHFPMKWIGYREVGWTAQYLHGAREGYKVCGKGQALCPGDRPPRLGDDLPYALDNFHCAAPHENVWPDEIYMRCHAKCDATLMEPEWDLLPEAVGNTSLSQPRRAERAGAAAR